MIRIVLSAALLAFPAAVGAQSAVQSAAQPAAQPNGQAGDTPQRIRSVTVTGEERCPPSTADEVVVCRRAEDPYRIPEALRDTGPIAKQNQAWGNRVADMREIDRRAGGVPNSCSPIGTAGQTGCSTQALNAWYAEKRAQQGAQGQLP